MSRLLRALRDDVILPLLCGAFAFFIAGEVIRYRGTSWQWRVAAVCAAITVLGLGELFRREWERVRRG